MLPEEEHSMKTVGQTFQNERVEVDGSVFERCVFDRCHIVYSATDYVQFVGCTFNSCDWVFSDAADLTLVYLSALYRGLGKQGQELVDAIFDQIRTGTLDRYEDQAPLPVAVG
jgi:hypothetical protein